MKVRALLRQQSYTKNHVLIDEALKRSIWQFLEAGLQHDEAMQEVQRVQAFALMYNRDLSCLFEDLDDPPSAAHRNLYARLILLIADECFAKMPILLGKRFRQAVAVWKIPAEIEGQFRELSRRLRSIKKSDGQWVGELRDNIIGHRDVEVAKQARLRDQLDVARAEVLANQLLDWTNALHECLRALLAFRIQTQKLTVKQRNERDYWTPARRSDAARRIASDSRFSKAKTEAARTHVARQVLGNGAPENEQIVTHISQDATAVFELELKPTK